MGLLLLILIISGLTLHSWFFIDIQSNAFVKFDKIVNPRKNTFLISLNICIYTISYFDIKYLWTYGIASLVLLFE